MRMYRRILAVVAVVLVVAGVGGFFMLKESTPGPLTWADRAQVTGYATSTIKGHTAGAVSVELDGASAARIDAIVEGLPPANLRYICAENAQEYHITFSADAGAGVRQGFALTGYWCNNLVVEVPWHGRPVDRIDRDCSLLSAVRQLLPASAVATHAGTCAHANDRLFLAASRHATRTHKTAKHPAAKTSAAKHPAAKPKAPTSKSPVRKTSPRTPPTHKPAPRKAPRREGPRPGRVRRGAPIRVIRGRGTWTYEARDVKKVVAAPTLG
jgi:hypothetical protein